MTRSQNAREKIAKAGRAALVRHSLLTELLDDLDGDVAARAFEVFESPQAAAQWLITEDIPALRGRAPVEVAKTKAGKLRVLQVLGALEHGVFL